MKTAILGTGAIGSLFAASIAHNTNHEVICLVRSARHAESINQTGITIQEPDGSLMETRRLRALTDTSGESPADLVIVTVKAYDTADAVRSHKNLFGPNTVVLTVQNGYGNHTSILDCGFTDRDHMALGSTAQAMNIRPDGTVVHAGSGVTTLGPLDPDSPVAQASVELAANLLAEAGLPVDRSNEIIRTVLNKVLMNVAINPVCALYNKENRFINEDSEMNDRARKLIFEAMDVMEAAGFTFPRHEVWAKLTALAERTGNNVCSMLQDVRAGRATEICYINGAVVSMAKEQGIAAPENSKITAEIESLPRA